MAVLPSDADAAAVVNGAARKRRRLEVLLRRPRRECRRLTAAVGDLVKAVALPQAFEGHVDPASALKDCPVARLLQEQELRYGCFSLAAAAADDKKSSDEDYRNSSHMSKLHLGQI